MILLDHEALLRSSGKDEMEFLGEVACLEQSWRRYRLVRRYEADLLRMGCSFGGARD